MPDSAIQRSFAAGELAPSLSARADLAKYVTGLKTCRNFVVQRHGGVTNRMGTRFVADAKTAGETFLRPFLFAAAGQSYVIECGELYFRFHHEGAPVVVTGVVAWSNATAYVVGDLASRLGVNYYCVLAHTNQQPPAATYWYPLTGDIYEIPTPYSVGKFKPPAPLGWSQAGSVVTITHLDLPRMALTRFGPTTWTLTAITTGPSIAPPAAPGGTAGAVGTRTFQYVVTAAKAETYEESYPSATITIPLAADPTTAAPHVLTWTAVPGAAEYYVYGDGGAGNGTVGFLGVATGVTTFNDTALAPDFGQTPPIVRTGLWDATLRYPAVSTVYQQRQLFAGSHDNREIVHASQVGFYQNFSIRSPLQDDDAITFSLASNQIQPVRHLIGLARLVLLTDAGEWLLQGADENGTLLPTSLNPQQVGYVGASFTPPVVVGAALLFVQARGSVLRDLRLDEQVKGLSGRDLSLYAAHLFTGATLTQLAYAQVPDSVVWAIRSDGVLLGLTYIPEEDVWGWHRHDTDGSFDQVCVIPEGDEDAVYVIVRRTINGATKRYLERFDCRYFYALEDALFLDCGLTYNGAPVTTITGLSHLRAKGVRVLADGVALAATFTVSATGTITLPAAASVVQVGLPIVAEMETLDLDVAGSSIRDKRKRVMALSLMLEASARGFFVGPDAAHLFPQRAESWEPAGLVTGRVEITTTSAFTDHGRILIRHSDPLPLTILGVMPHVEVGG